MQILTVDIGTGTQDVLLFDSDREIENNFKLVMPSPTVVVAQSVRRATAAGRPLVLSGVTMGGGPCHWATMDHLRAGGLAYATPEAARTFDDDLDAVGAMGIQVVADEEADTLVARGAERVTLGDFWLDQILETFERFGAEVRLDAMAIAVFDHGAAPPGFSDRIFRFDYLRERFSEGHGLAGFGFTRECIPASMTRLQAVAATAPNDVPLLVMDTAPAAVLGALDDPRVGSMSDAIVANVGNFHCLAFHLRDGAVAGLFEHHTGELSAARLGALIRELEEGTLTNASVYEDQGHGALILDATVTRPQVLAATGPRRNMLVESGLNPYLAVPHGDMMLTGNVGLLRAYAAAENTVREAVERRLGPVPVGGGVRN